MCNKKMKGFLILKTQEKSKTKLCTICLIRNEVIILIETNKIFFCNEQGMEQYNKEYSFDEWIGDL